MSNFKGKRMVSEDLIKKLETLEPGGGGEYTAGTGIEISAENEISIDTDTVATKSELFSGDYDDLTNKPDLSVYAESADLATVATTGAYSDLSGTPTLATVATTGDYDDLLNKPTIPSAQVNSDWNASSGVAEILNKPTLATVATTGAYSDLSGTPTIPAAVSGTNDGTNWTSLTVGSDTYDIPAGGSGSSYTFTNGLTESSGTVSWDLNDNIIKQNNGLVLKTYTTNNITNDSGPNLAFGYTQNSTSSIHTTGSGSLAFGYAGFASQFNYGEIKSSGLGSLAFGRAGTNVAGKEGHIMANGENGGNGLAFGNTIKGTIQAGYNGDGFNVAGGFITGTVNSSIKATGNASIAYGEASNTIGNILASGEASIAIGRGVQATGSDSIALGYKSVCSGAQSETHGLRTKASGAQQFVIGKDNIEDSAGTYAFIIGNGTADNARSNAMTVAWDGTIVSNNLPAVSGTDGTYQLTATTSSGTTTYSWAAGGSGGKYLHKVKIYANFSGTQYIWTEDFVSSSATAYTSVSDYLTDRGYTVTSVSDQPTKSLDTEGSSITALAYRNTVGYVTSSLTINTTGTATYGSWTTQSNAPSIQDEVIAL